MMYVIPLQHITVLIAVFCQAGPPQWLEFLQSECFTRKIFYWEKKYVGFTVRVGAKL